MLQLLILDVIISFTRSFSRFSNLQWEPNSRRRLYIVSSDLFGCCVVLKHWNQLNVVLRGRVNVEANSWTSHFLCSVLSLHAGFSDGKSYCLLILGRDKSGSWPLSQPLLRGFCRSWALFVLIVYIHCPSPLFFFHFPDSLRRLFLFQLVGRAGWSIFALVGLSRRSLSICHLSLAIMAMCTKPCSPLCRWVDSWLPKYWYSEKSFYLKLLHVIPRC